MMYAHCFEGHGDTSIFCNSLPLKQSHLVVESDMCHDCSRAHRVNGIDAYLVDHGSGCYSYHTGIVIIDMIISKRLVERGL